MKSSLYCMTTLNMNSDRLLWNQNERSHHSHVQVLNFQIAQIFGGQNCIPSRQESYQRRRLSSTSSYSSISSIHIIQLLFILFLIPFIVVRTRLNDSSTIMLAFSML